MKRGPGRPAGRVTDRNLNIRLPNVELVDAHYGAKLADMSLSEFVREAMRRFLWELSQKN